MPECYESCLQAILTAITNGKSVKQWMAPECKATLGAWVLKALKVPTSKATKRERTTNKTKTMYYFPLKTLTIAVELACLKYEWLIPLVKQKWPEKFQHLSSPTPPLFRATSTLN
jgi:hypothetical protein